MADLFISAALLFRSDRVNVLFANRFYFFSVFLLSLPIISASLSNICTVTVVAWNPVHTFSSLLYWALIF